MATRQARDRAADETDEAKSARSSTASRTRFAVFGVGIALAIALTSSLLARWLSVRAELTTFVVAAVALAALGARLSRNVAALERETLEDPMTCIGNRRQWESSLTVEVERAVRSRMPLSVLMLDLDHFKALNDACGHSCGDRALALVAEVLRDTCRSRDVATRFGGDEFAVLLPRTRIEEARVAATRIRSELARRRAELGSPLDSLITVSIGVADLDGVAEPTPRLLFDSADHALYRAKAAGRDRIEVWAGRRVSGVLRLDERVLARKSRASA